MLETVLIVRLVAAALLGGLLGLERSIAGKHAGMRTYAMVSLGSALFVGVGTIASFQLSMFSGVNPLQIASNVVVAIGFLGVGLTVFRGEHPVELPPSAWAKVLLLNEMLAQKVTPSELARRLHTRPQDVNRVIDLAHATKIDRLNEAMRALGKSLQVIAA